MVYIGGVNHFVGAVLGAVAITWLQVSLSDYTTAWMLYLGLLFMLVVAFVPGGIAGLVMVHIRVWRTRAFAAILRAYAAALPFALIATFGAVTLIEIVYRRATQPEAGSRMTLFWMPMDTARPWPWIGAAIALIAGAWLLMRLKPRVLAAWDLAGEEMASHA
jgi:branched-chain amino acid transport system permease protein